jgi:hypothetical protein
MMQHHLPVNAAKGEWTFFFSATLLAQEITELSWHSLGEWDNKQLCLWFIITIIIL